MLVIQWLSYVTNCDDVFVLLLIVCLAIGVGAFLFCLMKKFGRKRMSSDVEGEKGVRSSKRHELLTQSIITWNKKVVQKHQHKNVAERADDPNFISMNKNHALGNLSSNKKLENSEEEGEGYQPFEDLSQIDVDNQPKQSSESKNNSYFLEEFKL